MKAYNPPRILFPSGKNEYSDLRKLLNNCEGWALIVDVNTKDHCRGPFLNNLDLVPDLEIVLEAGDRNKELKQCEKIWDRLLDGGFSKRSALVALGGGTVNDIVGFAASSYKRSIEFVNVPTTLLAMADASVGGKNAVNFKGIKNQIGSFHQPVAVLYDLTFLNTLTPDDLLSGWAEVLKHGLICDREFWNELKTMGFSKTAELETVLRKSVEIKLNIVENDPFENDIRKTLNFGHSIGHAMESHLIYEEGSEISHGFAVAAGMICEAFISVKKGLLNSSEMEEINHHLKSLYGIFSLPGGTEKGILESIFHDKKNRKGRCNFTLLKTIGEAVTDVSVNGDEIISSLEYYQSLG